MTRISIVKTKVVCRGVLPRRGVSAAACVALASGLAVGATESDLTPNAFAEWDAPVSGDWTHPGNWSPHVVPNNDDGVRYRATIAEPGLEGETYTVTIGQGILITEFDFSSADAILDVTSGSLEVESFTTLGAGRLTGGPDGSFLFGSSAFGNGRSNGPIVTFNGTQVDGVGRVEVGGPATLTDTDFFGVGQIEFSAGTVLTNVSFDGGSDAPMTVVNTSADGLTEFNDSDFSNADVNLNGMTNLRLGTNSSIDDTCVDVGIGASANVMTDDGGFNLSGQSMINVNGGGLFQVSGGDSTSTGDGTGDQSVNIASGGEFRVTGPNTQEFTGIAINNQGLIRSESGASFITDGVDVQNGLLVGGAYSVGAASEIDFGEGNSVRTLAADVTLEGVGSVFGSIETLEVVEDGGRFAVMGGRSFTTSQDLDVRNGGSLDVGESSAIDINGRLDSLVEGVLESGTYVIGGTLSATNTNLIERVEGDLTLSGAGTITGGDEGDAILALTEIGATGRVAAVDDRDILGLSELTNEGELRIGIGSTVSGRVGSESVPGSEVSVVGDYVQAHDSTLVIEVGNGSFGALAVDGAFIFGSADEPGQAGTLIIEFVGDVEVGDSFELITASEFRGDFLNIEAIDLDTGEMLDVAFNGGGLIVTVVPAPSSVLTLAGLAAFAQRRRR